jgi:histidinol-phosphate aminotransferase
VAVDECNYEYLGESVVDLIQEYPNLVISRSFSKNFGLAGFRLGFAVSSTRNIAKIAHYCQHFRVNKMAEMAGIKVLKYLAYFQEIWEEIARVRDQFINGLQQIGIMVFPSRANFVLADFVSLENTKKVWQYLRKEGVYTFAAWGEEFSGLDEHYIRFTISNQQEMDYVLTLLERFQKEN